MSMTPAELMAFALLAATKASERGLSQTPLMMTMVPGPPAQRAALASLAVTMQARDALRRERRVVAATIDAVADIARGASPAHVLLRSPVLCDLDVDDLLAEVRELWGTYGQPTFGLDVPREGDVWERT